MNKLFVVPACVALSILVQADPALGQAGTWGGSIGYNHQPSEGLALTAFAGREIRFAGLGLRPLLAVDLILSNGEQSALYRHDFDDPRNACRDVHTREVADDALCRPKYEPAVRGEVLVEPGAGIGLGGGLRLGTEHEGPYVAAQYQRRAGASPTHWFGHAAAGRGFVQLDIGVGFRF